LKDLQKRLQEAWIKMWLQTEMKRANVIKYPQNEVNAFSSIVKILETM
jgi:hypothetical protein